MLKLDEIKETKTICGAEVEKKGARAGLLSPTFWRTVRSLKNVNRLNLLKSVFDNDGRLGVVAVGMENGVSESVASDYLRKMNARGIISVRRKSKFVFYDTKPDRSLPRAISLQEGFRDYFSRELPADWQKQLCRIMKGFSHYNRLNILRWLCVMGECNRRSLIHAAGICEKNFQQHLEKLKSAGLIKRSSVGRGNFVFTIKEQTNPIAVLLFEAATCDLGLKRKPWLGK